MYCDVTIDWRIAALDRPLFRISFPANLDRPRAYDAQILWSLETVLGFAFSYLIVRRFLRGLHGTIAYLLSH